MFFKTIDGTIYPTSRISRIRRGKWKDDSLARREAGRVYLVGDDEFGEGISDDEIDAVLGGAGAVVPAHSGFTLLAYWYTPGANEDPFVNEMPVIAWRVDGENAPTPIVIDYDFDGMTGIHAIRYPDGRVVDHFGGAFWDRENWEEHMRMRLEEEAQRSASSPAPAP